MPILKKLPGRSKSCHEFPRTTGGLILPRLDLDLSDLKDLNHLQDLQEMKDLNPFHEVDLGDDDNERNGSGGGGDDDDDDAGLIMADIGGYHQHHQNHQHHHQNHGRDGEVEENEVNAERHGAGGHPKGRPLRGTLERICGVSPLKTLGKLGKGLRISGRSVWGGVGGGGAQRSPAGANTLPPEKEKRKGLRRSSEEIMTLLR